MEELWDKIPPGLKRLVVTAATAGLIALNKKLGLQLEVADITALTALAIAFIGQSALKEAKLKGAEAAAKVVTVDDAAKELGK